MNFISNEAKFLNGENIKIYCARGGMRSQSMFWLLEKFKYQCVTLNGGYKTYRNWVLNVLKKSKNLL